MNRQEPLERLSDNWKIWGVPVEVEWWRQQSVNTAQKLCLYDKDHGIWFTACVAAALEQLQVWVKSGLKVKGRTWIDVGGGYGYYSVALKLLGAASVTLIDPIRPSKWTKPVCEAIGVQVITADGNKTAIRGAESALLLYVPDVSIRDVFLQHPHLTQMMINDTWLIEKWLTKVGWQERDVIHRDPFFVLGDDGAAINIHGQECDSCESLLTGPVVKRPVPEIIQDDYSPLFQETDSDDNLLELDSGDLPF